MRASQPQGLQSELSMVQAACPGLWSSLSSPSGYLIPLLSPVFLLPLLGKAMFSVKTLTASDRNPIRTLNNKKKVYSLVVEKSRSILTSRCNSL